MDPGARERRPSIAFWGWAAKEMAGWVMHWNDLGRLVGPAVLFGDARAVLPQDVFSGLVSSQARMAREQGETLWLSATQGILLQQLRVPYGVVMGSPHRLSIEFLWLCGLNFNFNIHNDV